MSSANLVAEIHWKLCEKTALSTGEPCTSEYITLRQSFHRGLLSIHWYVAQNFSPTFSMSVLFRRLFRAVIFSRFSKVAIATSTFMYDFYNGGSTWFSSAQSSFFTKFLVNFCDKIRRAHTVLARSKM